MTVVLIQYIPTTARPQYRRGMPSTGLEKRTSLDNKNEREGLRSSRLVSQGSRTLRQAIQLYTPVQVRVVSFHTIIYFIRANGT